MSIRIMDVESIRGDEYYTLEKDAETIAQHIDKPGWLKWREELSKEMERRGNDKPY